MDECLVRTHERAAGSRPALPPPNAGKSGVNRSLNGDGQRDSSVLVPITSSLPDGPSTGSKSPSSADPPGASRCAQRRHRRPDRQPQPRDGGRILENVCRRRAVARTPGSVVSEGVTGDRTSRGEVLAQSPRSCRSRWKSPVTGRGSPNRSRLEPGVPLIATGLTRTG
jgi:hypothetical protein